jgi:PPK2 family polyphosphate:nucleotide phosphotransferase
MKSLADRVKIEPGSKVHLAKFDARASFGYSKGDSARALLQKNLRKLYELQALLYADRRYALLIVLQALDAGGKDGTIRHVMAGVNPQGCEVVSFKTPTAEELDHDFLWRVHRAVPRRGNIGIFNRSHYEDVLIARVHNLVPKSVWSERYDQINAFEKILVENNTRILKFFLHISKDEQKARFEERIQNPVKNWKISEADFLERNHWDEYVKAYEDVLEKCSTSYAPWFVIPADRKWFRNLAVSQIIVDALDSMKLRYPAPSIDLTRLTLDGAPVSAAAD